MPCPNGMPPSPTKSYSSVPSKPRVRQVMSSLLVNHEIRASHLHLKESASIPSVIRADSFAITRLESPIGLADRITKVSRVPALLVSVSIKSIAIGEYQLWLED